MKRHGVYLRIFMNEVTKVTEIEIKIGTCLDLSTILDKSGHSMWCCAKNGDSSHEGTESTAEQSLLLFTFQNSEKPVMSWGCGGGRDE